MSVGFRYGFSLAIRRSRSVVPSSFFLPAAPFAPLFYFLIPVCFFEILCCRAPSQGGLPHKCSSPMMTAKTPPPLPYVSSLVNLPPQVAAVMTLFISFFTRLLAHNAYSGGLSPATNATVSLRGLFSYRAFAPLVLPSPFPLPLSPMLQHSPWSYLVAEVLKLAVAIPPLFNFPPSHLHSALLSVLLLPNLGLTAVKSSTFQRRNFLTLSPRSFLSFRIPTLVIVSLERCGF